MTSIYGYSCSVCGQLHITGTYTHPLKEEETSVIITPPSVFLPPNRDAEIIQLLEEIIGILRDKI